MLDNGCNVVHVCTELIAKIAKLKSRHSSHRQGSDDNDDDEPSEWASVNVTLAEITDWVYWLLSTTYSAAYDWPYATWQLWQLYTVLLIYVSPV